MRRLPLPKLTCANIIATVAVFIALSGGAYGALRTSDTAPGVITACTHNATGAIRIVRGAGECAARDEAALHWYDKTASDAMFLPKARFGTDRTPSTATESHGYGLECYIGELKLVAFNFAPPGTLFADGQMLKIRDHAALYTLIGTEFGGDGRDTFALPDLHGLGPGHTNYAICVNGIFPQRNP
ncbi:MAG TPA: tail fiber protein [Mycobacterium sp.]|jgi:hypothetical protein|nr:tail fiber protein [Mycobacterium sp.]